MAKPPSSSLHDQSATVRQLKLLVIVLVLSNIGLGLFAFFLLRTIDRQYSDLIGRSVPVLNGLQTLTATSMQAMRATNPLLFEGAGGQRPQRVQEAAVAFAADRDARKALLTSEWAAAEAERAQLQGAGEGFTQLGSELLAHLAAGRMAEAARLREVRLRPAFDRYVAIASKAADVLEAESRRLNDTVSAKTGSMSTVVLGVASWPLVVLVALLLLTALFVVVLMVLFRGREMSDMP